MQSEVRERASVIFAAKYPQFGRLAKTFDTAGIDKRYPVVPMDLFSKDHGWSDRKAGLQKADFIATVLFDDAVATVCISKSRSLSGKVVTLVNLPPIDVPRHARYYGMGC